MEMVEGSLGDRMKSYEDKAQLEKGVVLVRVDGKAFHTWTKKAGLDRPFDESMHFAMQHATIKTAMEMQGFRIAYSQSDETTFLLENLKEESGAWFDYKVQKLASITASMFTLHFNIFMRGREPFAPGWTPAAYFDARVFSMPVEDAANNFVWRQQDNTRNHIQAKAHHVFSHSQVQNKNGLELVQMLFDAGYGVDTLPGWVRYGTFVVRQADRGWDVFDERLTYDEINQLAGLEEQINAANNS
jgi:tRNA(His) 5'-end guanylyltransferase